MSPPCFSVSVVPSYWILRGATYTTNGFDRLNPRWCSCRVGRVGSEANGLSGSGICVCRSIMTGEVVGCIVAADHVIFLHRSSLTLFSSFQSPIAHRRPPAPTIASHHLQVQEIKKIQTKGGTCLGEANPTWLKQPGDMGVALFGAGLTAYGTISCIVGHYRLATGKGKLE